MNGGALMNYSIIISVFCLIVVFFQPVVVIGQEVTTWPELDYGPYAVGFKSIEKYDSSRTFGQRTDYFGNTISENIARPIQMCVWYPAKKSDLPSLMYGEYIFPYPSNTQFFAFLTNIQNREMIQLQGLYQNNSSYMVKSLDVPMKAQKEAPSAEGPFPVVIYFPSAQHGISEGALLCEYLASNGLVVISSHSFGVNSLHTGINAEDIEAMVRDREFLLTLLSDIEYVDRERVGVLGYGSGSIAALLMSMRNSDIDAFAGLESTMFETDYFDLISELPFYNPSYFTIPCLQITFSSDEPLEMKLLEKLRYCSRYAIQIREGQPRDVINIGNLRIIMDDDPIKSKKRIEQAYYTVGKYLVHFFLENLTENNSDFATLIDDPSMANIDTNNIIVKVFRAEAKPPTKEQFLSMLTNTDIDTVVEICNKFKLAEPQSPILLENEFNAYGYAFLQRNHPEAAIEIFSMGAHAYPYSANSWDSLGEACMNHGEYTRALEYYKKALELLPTDTATPDELKQLISQNGPGIIERLKGLIAEQEQSTNENEE